MRMSEKVEVGFEEDQSGIQPRSFKERSIERMDIFETARYSYYASMLWNKQPLQMTVSSR